MREIARDQVEVMQSLGHDRFGVVGHDRGARCAYRLALDHPDAVARLAVLDIVPTADTFGHVDLTSRARSGSGCSSHPRSQYPRS
jgi:haloacetate dehalogenase